MMRSHNKRIWPLGLIVGGVIVILVRTGTPTNPMTSESGGVQHAFEGIFSAVSKKEAGPLSWITPVHAGTVSYADDSRASLWVPKSSPLGNRSSCFFVDEPRRGGASGFLESMCTIPKSEVILERQGPVVIGFVSMAKAKFATITSDGITFDAPITFGYFIFPSALSGDPKSKFTISFVDPGGATCKVNDLMAPGTADSIQCVIA